MQKVLAMGAHFDDIEVSMGGTLMRHIEVGDEVYICIICADEFRTGAPVMRLKEQISVLNYLGLAIDSRLICFNMNDDDYYIISELDKYNIDVIYTSYEDDTHQDHRRCSHIGQSVGRKACVTTLFYGGASVRNFLPNIFIRVDERKKIRLLKLYTSQIKCRAINIDRIRKRGYYWGTMISSDSNCYAEGFVVNKMEIKI